MNQTQIGRYQIIEEIKKGGMAAVYRAYDPRFERDVAIKVLTKSLANETQFRARFSREATTVAALEHAAIVPVYDFGEHEGQLYLVMRHMSGGSLADKIKQGPLSLEETAVILQRLAGGLALAHQRNIIHRDLKPANILFDEQGKAYLSDFGIAKMVEQSETVLTIAGGVIGTPRYMSPEQARGDREIDRRSDIYSLGVIYFEMLTGTAPYDGGTPVKLAQMHIFEPIPSILTANPHLPAGCQPILERAMAKEPVDRYSTVTDFAQAIQGLFASKPEPEPKPAGSFPTRKAAVIGLAGVFLLFLLVVCLGGGIAVYSYLNRDEGPDVAEAVTINAANPILEVTNSPPAEVAAGEIDEATVVAAGVPSATPPPPAEPTERPATPTLAPTPIGIPIVFDGAFTREVGPLDPQLANNTGAVDLVENLFVNLTNYSAPDSSLVPEAAESWEISDDGLRYTFHLRADIPWVNYNPETADTTQVEDEDGNPRFVTAADFVYGIRRICDPRLAAANAGEFVNLITGCQAVKQTPAEGFNPGLFAAISVSAPDDQTLVIELIRPAGYFLSLAAMPQMSAVPGWLIEAEAENWTAAGTIVSSGRYVLSSWTPAQQLSITRNPLIPAALRGEGNIETLNFTIQADEAAVYNLWQSDAVDLAQIPLEALENHRLDHEDETMVISDQITFYLAFRMTKPPFDDVHVRRAFSAAYDRQAYIDQLRLGRDWVARHFAPPGIFGALPLDDVGLVFDPDYAGTEMAIAGYPNCEGFPQISMVGNTAEGTLEWLEFSRSQWVDNLGCAEELFQIEQMAFPDLLASVQTTNPDEVAPHIWTYGWGKVYPDENAWVGTVNWCENSFNHSNRSCNEIDDFIVQARETTEPAIRIDLYAQIELLLFGLEGEIPSIPVFHQTRSLAVKSWLLWEPVEAGGQHWYDWQLDILAKAG